MSIILMATLFYKALILQGEIWCWSLLGLKGYNSFERSKLIKGVLPNHGKTERQDLINLKR